MVQLATNQPFRSREPQITVENPLKPGSYRFSLVVLDEAQNPSQPAELTVTVVEPTRTVLRPEILRATETVREPISIRTLRVPR